MKESSIECRHKHLQQPKLIIMNPMSWLFCARHNRCTEYIISLEPWCLFFVIIQAEQAKQSQGGHCHKYPSVVVQTPSFWLYGWSDIRQSRPPNGSVGAMQVWHKHRTFEWTLVASNIEWYLVLMTKYFFPQEGLNPSTEYRRCIRWQECSWEKICLKSWNSLDFLFFFA